MELVFNCLRTGDVFKSDQYEIKEHRGVKTDAQGRRFLDAKVVLSRACPFCGEKHVYAADMLACPFGG